jgi:hypothetical protein
MTSKKNNLDDGLPGADSRKQGSSLGTDSAGGHSLDKPATYQPIQIERHRQLVGNQREIFQRINANPELSKFFLINPVMALKELGVTLSPEMTHHVLSATRHPPGFSKRRSELEDRLKKATGEEPQPNNPEWVSEFLFKGLELEPLDTSNQEPKYLEPLNAQIVKNLQARRPTLRKATLSRRGRPLSGTVLGVATWRPATRRFDLKAELPKLNTLRTAPAQVGLEELYFYKDSHPLARDLLELGIIQRRGFPIQSADSFRKIKQGTKRNAFYTWIKQVRFSEKPEK